MSEDQLVTVGIFAQLAEACGTSAPALKLLVSIISGYPLAFLYRYTVYNKSANIQHIYFTICGVGQCYFNYGYDVIHSISCATVLFLLLAFFGGTRASVWAAYTYFMGYLLVGYYFTETDEYDITWTMPHCVLTLRIIGLVVDVYDGHKHRDTLSKDQLKVALTKSPSLLETFGYTFFFGAFMAGPQLSMKRYLKFTNGELIESKQLPNSAAAGLQRGATAIGYMIAFLTMNAYFPISYLFTPEFKNSSFLMKHIMLGICGKLLFCKYIICWLLAEGSCIIVGITHNGKDANGQELWNGCRNVNLIQFETATQFQQVIQSFNVLTSRWAAHYIYKRLKFLGNKLVSQAVTLAFLAVWHGLHIGYYICFALEFGVIKLEQDVEKFVEKNPKLKSFLNNPVVRPIKLVLLRMYIIIFLGYCMLSLAIPSWSKVTEVYTSVHFSGHILYFGWLVCCPVVFSVLKWPKRNPETNGVKTE